MDIDICSHVVDVHIRLLLLLLLPSRGSSVLKVWRRYKIGLQSKSSRDHSVSKDSILIVPGIQSHIKLASKFLETMWAVKNRVY